MLAAIAHRGARKFAPENTMPAFEKAMEMGLDYIEIDVRQSRDGELFLSHDSTVERMTGQPGRVGEMESSEIRSLNASVGFGPDFPKTKIPTLAETLERCRRKIKIYLDLKDARVASVVSTLEEYDMIQDTVVYSSIDTLIELKRCKPTLRVMPGPGRWLSVPGVATAIVKSLPAEVVDSNISDYTRERVDEVHAAGALVFVDTLGPKDTREGMIEAIKMGVDGIDTDHPDVLMEVLQERSLR